MLLCGNVGGRRPCLSRTADLDGRPHSSWRAESSPHLKSWVEKQLLLPACAGRGRQAPCPVSNNRFVNTLPELSCRSRANLEPCRCSKSYAPRSTSRCSSQCKHFMFAAAVPAALKLCCSGPCRRPLPQLHTTPSSHHLLPQHIHPLQRRDGPERPAGRPAGGGGQHC